MGENGVDDDDEEEVVAPGVCSMERMNE